MIAKQVINNHRYWNINGVGLSVPECCKVSIVDDLHNLLKESLLQIIAFIVELNLFCMSSLFCLYDIW